MKGKQLQNWPPVDTVSTLMLLCGLSMPIETYWFMPWVMTCPAQGPSGQWGGVPCPTLPQSQNQDDLTVFFIIFTICLLGFPKSFLHDHLLGHGSKGAFDWSSGRSRRRHGGGSSGGGRSRICRSLKGQTSWRRGGTWEFGKRWSFGDLSRCMWKYMCFFVWILRGWLCGNSFRCGMRGHGRGLWFQRRLVWRQCEGMGEWDKKILCVLWRMVILWGERVQRGCYRRRVKEESVRGRKQKPCPGKGKTPGCWQLFGLMGNPFPFYLK